LTGLRLRRGITLARGSILLLLVHDRIPLSEKTVNPANHQENAWRAAGQIPSADSSRARAAPEATTRRISASF
jgi:hypothetical protein